MYILSAVFISTNMWVITNLLKQIDNLYGRNWDINCLGPPRLCRTTVSTNCAVFKYFHSSLFIDCWVLRMSYMLLLVYLRLPLIRTALWVAMKMRHADRTQRLRPHVDHFKVRGADPRMFRKNWMMWKKRLFQIIDCSCLLYSPGTCAEVQRNRSESWEVRPSS